MIGGRHMRVRADDEAGAAVDEMAKALFFAGGFGVEVEDDGVGLLLERAGGQDRLGRLEGIVEFRMHEHPAHDVGDEDAGAVASVEQAGAASGGAGRIIGGPQKLVVARREDHRVLLVPDMVAGGHHVGAGIDRFQEDVLGDAETAGGILAVDDDEIQLEVGNQSRQPVPDRRPSGLADHVAEEE